MVQGFPPQGAVVIRALALAALAGASLAPLARPLVAVAADRFQLQVSAGYDGYARSDDWTPVRVTIRNNGDDYHGVLQVDDAARSQVSGASGFGASLAPAGGPVTAAPVGFASRQVAVVVPSGSTRHYTLYIAGAQRPRATLVSGSSAVASAEPTQTLTFTGPSTLLVAVISDQADTLDQLARAQPTTSASVHVVHFKPDELPPSGVLLRSFDAVVFDDASTDTLTSDQRRALSDYVQGGGGLLLVGGPGAPKTLAGIPVELQPVKPGATVSNDLHVVGGLASTAAPKGGAEVSTGELAAAGHAISDGQVPIVGWLHFGGGEVVYTAFDPAAEPMASWPGERAILRQLVDRATGSPTGAVYNVKGFSSRPATGGRGGTIVDYGAVSGVLNNLPSLDVPQLGLVGWLLFGYAVLVGPVNYLVLKRVGRRQLAWLTIPAVVAVSSSAVLLVGLTIKGVGTQVNQVRVIGMSPGSSRLYTVTYSGLVAAHRGDYTLSLADAAFAGSAPSSGNPNADDSVSIQGDPPAALLRGVTAYSIRTLAAEGYADAQGHLDASLRLSSTDPSGTTIAGTVTNNTGLELEDAVVIYGSQFQQLRRLPAGQAREVSFKAGPANQVNGGDVASAIYPNGGGGKASGPTTDRQQQVRAQILRGLLGSGLGPGFQSGPPMVVAFAPSALRPPIVDGSPVKVQGEAVLVMAVPLGADPAITAVRAGDVVATLVDVEGDIQNQGFTAPNLPVLRVAGGTATYEFGLPGGGWKSAELVATPAVAGGGGCAIVSAPPTLPVPGPGSTAPGSGGSAGGSVAEPSNCVQAGLAAFNFRTAQWVTLTPGTSATRFALDPAGGLISPDGVVLVRFSAPPGSAAVVSAPEITARRGPTT